MNEYIELRWEDEHERGAQVVSASACLNRAFYFTIYATRIELQCDDVIWTWKKDT